MRPFDENSENENPIEYIRPESSDIPGEPRTVVPPPRQNPITWLMTPPMTQHKIIILLSILTGAIVVTSALFWFAIHHTQASSSETPTLTPVITPQSTPVDTPTDVPTDTDTPSPTDTPISQPTATPGPTNTPTPTTSPFSVLTVTARVDPSTDDTCQQTFQFNGTVAVNGTGTITYRWDRSDNTVSDTYTLAFPDGGTLNVQQIGWDQNTAISASMKLHVLTPNEMYSDRATFTDNCTNPSTTPTP